MERFVVELDHAAALAAAEDQSGEADGATAWDESPVYIAAGQEHLFGVLTRAVGPANGDGILLLHAGAKNMSAHKGSTWARLARRMAAEGFLSLRLDYHGTGDSTGVLVDRRVAGQTNDDIDAAIQLLVSQGAERVAIVGTCWGSLVALSAAARRDVVTSVCLISPPLRLLDSGASPDLKGVGKVSAKPVTRTVRQLGRLRAVKLLLAESDYRSYVVRHGRRRLSKYAGLVGGQVVGKVRKQVSQGDEPGSRTLLAPLIERKVPMHMLLEEKESTQHEVLQPGAFPSLDAASSIVDIAMTTVSVHGLATLAAQDVVIETVQGWLRKDRSEGSAG